MPLFSHLLVLQTPHTSRLRPIFLARKTREISVFLALDIFFSRPRTEKLDKQMLSIVNASTLHFGYLITTDSNWNWNSSLYILLTLKRYCILKILDQLHFLTCQDLRSLAEKRSHKYVTIHYLYTYICNTSYIACIQTFCGAFNGQVLVK